MRKPKNIKKDPIQELQEIVLSKENPERVKIYQDWKVAKGTITAKDFCIKHNISSTGALYHLEKNFDFWLYLAEESYKVAGKYSIYMVKELSRKYIEKIHQVTGIDNLYEFAHVFRLNKDRNMVKLLGKPITKHLEKVLPLILDDEKMLFDEYIEDLAVSDLCGRTVCDQILYYYGLDIKKEITDSSYIELGQIGDIIDHHMRLSEQIVWLNSYLRYFFNQNFGRNNRNDSEIGAYIGRANWRYLPANDEALKDYKFSCECHVKDPKYNKMLTIDIVFISDKDKKVYCYFCVRKSGYDIVDDPRYVHELLERNIITECIKEIMFRLLYLKNLYNYMDEILSGNGSAEIALQCLMRYPGVPVTHPGLGLSAEYIVSGIDRRPIAIKNKFILTENMVHPDDYCRKYANICRSEYWDKYPAFRDGWKLYTHQRYQDMLCPDQLCINSLSSPQDSLLPLISAKEGEPDFIINV